MEQGRGGRGLDVVASRSLQTSRTAGMPIFFDGRSRGYPDVFEKPWAEVVREGSPHFPGGKLEVTATAKLVVKE